MGNCCSEHKQNGMISYNLSEEGNEKINSIISSNILSSKKHSFFEENEASILTNQRNNLIISIEEDNSAYPDNIQSYPMTLDNLSLKNQRSVKNNSSPSKALKERLQAQRKISSMDKSRRNSILSCNNDHSDGMNFIDREITDQDIINITNVFLQHFLFDSFPQRILNQIFAELILVKIDKQRFVYQNGFEGHYFYILSNGSLELTILKPYQKKVIHHWDSFLSFNQANDHNHNGGSDNQSITQVKCLTDVEMYILEGELYQTIQNEIDTIRLQEKFNFLNKMEIFKSLESISRYNLALKINIVQFIKGEVLYSIGEKDETIFLINQGSVSGTSESNEHYIFRANEVLGVNEIITMESRKETFIANERTVCFIITSTDLKQALGIDYRDVILFSLFKYAFESHVYLKEIFTETKLVNIYHSFILCKYHKGEKVSNDKLESNKKIVIIIEGEFINSKSGEKGGVKGEIIGVDLISKPNNEISPNITARKYSITLEATLEHISQEIGIKFHTRTLSLLKRINKLKDFHLFNHLSDTILEIIASTMTKKKYNEKEVIIKEGTVGDIFYLIVKGRVKISHKGRTLRILEKGSCFGEIALIHADCKRTASVSALNSVICYELSKDNFDIIITDNIIKNCLKKKISLQKTSITLQDLYYISKIGQDNYGSIYLVHNKQYLYSLKIISKKVLEENKEAAKYITIAKDILLQLDHPLIMRMVKTIDHPIYDIRLNEYIDGQTFNKFLLGRTSIHNFTQTKFIASCLLIIITYLHKKMLVHRSINPSSFMIDSSGVIKAIGFGTAKVVTDYTKTVIGNPLYLAPEVVKGNGYSLSCDYWSIGVMVYEMFYGTYPFGSSKTDIVDLYKEILNKEITFPIESKPFIEINEFLKSLMEKNVHLRKCSLDRIRGERFFENYNWGGLLEYKISAPFKINHKGMSNEDVQNMIKKNHIPFTEVSDLLA